MRAQTIGRVWSTQWLAVRHVAPVLASVPQLSYASLPPLTRCFHTMPPCRALGKPNTKPTTAITGVPVVINAREVLLATLQRQLEELDLYGIPKDCSYYKHVASICNVRMRVVREHEDVEKIEDILAAGQIEELIEQAEDQRELTKEVAESKPWEGDHDIPVEIIVGEDEKKQILDYVAKEDAAQAAAAAAAAAAKAGGAAPGAATPPK